MLDKYGPVLWTVLALLSGYAVHTIRRWRWMRLKQFADIPQLGETSLIWGHLGLIGTLFKKGDPRRHIDQVLLEAYRDRGSPAVLFIDLRPIQYPMLVICNPEVAEQLTKTSPRWSSSVPKSPTLKNLWALTGHDSILTKEGENWKIQRKRLSPGFAPQHLLTTLPVIVDKTKYLLDHLDRFAELDAEFSLDKYLTNLTFDIIGAVTMGQDLKAQIPGEESELLRAFIGIASKFKGFAVPKVPGTKWLREWNQRKLANKIERLMMDIVRREFASVTSGKSGTHSRSVLGLSLQGTEQLTPELLQQTSDNLRVFMFAGHDTTSILMQWTFYELSRSPKQRAALVAELDSLFGTDVDPEAVRARLLSPGGAELLNSMSYAAAVIKETLRLHPAAATVRMTPPGTNFQLTLPDGKTICPDGCVMYINSFVIQHDASVWGEDVDDFVPERWLGDTSWMPAGIWRPFERGPRSCIGLELANIEAKVILALVTRRYDFVKMGLGELELNGVGEPVMDDQGYYRTRSTVFSSIQVTAKPVDGMRMKVKLTKRAIATT